MKTIWLHDCKTERDKSERLAALSAAQPAMMLLKQLLEKNLDALDDIETNVKEYELPSWAYKQADLIGCKRTYKKVIDLLPIEESND
jgi:hypothetical protein